MFKNSISKLNQVFLMVVTNRPISTILGDVTLFAVKKNSPNLQCKPNAHLKNDRECSEHSCYCPAEGYRSSGITRN